MGLAPGQPVYRVLVAEDHAESRKLLADLLTGLGFTVRTAENGAEAVAVWEEWQPHLIWMDMRMPVMDGHAATRRIRATAQEQAPIIIALTASVFESERASVIAAGCDDFVRKPFREEEIVACLVKYLGVEMLYTGLAPAANTTPSPPLTVLRDELPPGWIAQVHSAAIAADLATLTKPFVQVQATQPQLAATLRAHLDAFDYQAITELLTSQQETCDKHT